MIGGLNLKKYFGDKTISIFVKVQSLNELEARLRKRKTETELLLQTRLRKAKKDVKFAEEFDYILVNDNPEISCKKAERIVNSFYTNNQV